jgi:hypothetical protein
MDAAEAEFVEALNELQWAATEHYDRSRVRAVSSSAGMPVFNRSAALSDIKTAVS